MLHKWKRISVLVLISLCTACGEDIPVWPPEPTPTPIMPTASPTETPEPISNPPCEWVMDFRDGMLWKPVSDKGTLVVLIREEFEVPFEGCYVVTKEGVEEQMFFTGFSNGNRQTWRAKRKGGRYMNTFTCSLGIDMCLWEFRGKSSNRHE